MGEQIEKKEKVTFFVVVNCHWNVHSNFSQVASHAELLDRLVYAGNGPLASSFSALLQENMEDDFSMDFSDTLFTTLNQPFAFPSPKELGSVIIYYKL